MANMPHKVCSSAKEVQNVFSPFNFVLLIKLSKSHTRNKGWLNFQKLFSLASGAQSLLVPTLQY